MLINLITKYNVVPSKQTYQLTYLREHPHQLP